MEIIYFMKLCWRNRGIDEGNEIEDRRMSRVVYGEGFLMKGLCSGDCL